MVWYNFALKLLKLSTDAKKYSKNKKCQKMLYYVFSFEIHVSQNELMYLESIKVTRKRWNLHRNLGPTHQLSAQLFFLGLRESSEESLINILDNQKGNVAVLMVGGVSEAFKSFPGPYHLILKKRKGFVRVALKTG